MPRATRQGRRLRWATPDPVVFPLEDYPRVFRETRDALEQRVPTLLAVLP